MYSQLTITTLIGQFTSANKIIYGKIGLNWFQIQVSFCQQNSCQSRQLYCDCSYKHLQSRESAQRGLQRPKQDHQPSAVKTAGENIQRFSSVTFTKLQSNRVTLFNSRTCSAVCDINFHIALSI